MRSGLFLVLLLLAAATLVYLFLGGGPGTLGPDEERVGDRAPRDGHVAATLAGRGVDMASIPLDRLLDALVDTEGNPVPAAEAALRVRGTREAGLADELARRLALLLTSRQRYDAAGINRLASALVALREDGARALVSYLRRPEDQLFRFAAFQAQSFGDHAAPLVAELVALLGEVGALSPHRTAVLFSALEALGPRAAAAAPALIARLQPPYEDRFAAGAAQALAAITGPTEETMAALRGVIEDPETEIRSSAIHAVRTFGPEAASFVPLFVSLLEDPEAATRMEAANALGAIGVATPDVLRELSHMLIDDHLKYSAGLALAKLGADGTTVLLDTARHAESVRARIRALQALKTMQTDHTEIVDILIGILDEDIERGWKSQAIYLLHGIKPLPNSDRVLKALARAAEDPILQPALVQVLVGLGDDASLQVVADQALTAHTPEQRFAATSALVYLRRPVADAGRALLGLVDADLRRSDALRVLGLFVIIQPPVPVREGLPVLRPLLQDEDRAMRTGAMRAITTLAGDPLPLVDVYLPALDDPHLRAAAVQGLGGVPARASVTIPALLRRAEKDAVEHGFVGGDVVAALKTLAPHWAGAAEALRAAADGLEGRAKAGLEQVLAGTAPEK